MDEWILIRLDLGDIGHDWMPVFSWRNDNSDDSWWIIGGCLGQFGDNVKFLKIIWYCMVAIVAQQGHCGSVGINKAQCKMYVHL